MLSAKETASVLPGKIQLKLVAFVILFLAVSAVVTGFFIFNQPMRSDKAAEQLQIKKLAEEYNKGLILPKDVKFSKIKSFKVIRQNDTVLDAAITLDNGVSFTFINMPVVGKYFPDVMKVSTADQEGTKNVVEYIEPSTTYYKYLGNEVWFVKYTDNKEGGVFLPIGVKDGFEVSSKLIFEYYN